MEIDVHEDKKHVAIWLTKAEKNDPAVRERLKPICAEYKAKKYLVAVFESGEDDLYELTRDLLFFNRRRLAELELRRAKMQPAAER